VEEGHWVEGGTGWLASGVDCCVQGSSVTVFWRYKTRANFMYLPSTNMGMCAQGGRSGLSRGIEGKEKVNILNRDQGSTLSTPCSPFIRCGLCGVAPFPLFPPLDLFRTTYPLAYPSGSQTFLEELSHSLPGHYCKGT
jgi:hypothetical protein